MNLKSIVWNAEGQKKEREKYRVVASKKEKTSGMPALTFNISKKYVKLFRKMASLKRGELRSWVTEFWLTASSGRSSSSSSVCRRGKGIGQGHVTRTRNIGYILGLAGGGWLASQSPRPLKGGATLEGVDYFNLWESGTGEDKWLLRVTQTKWQHRLGDTGVEGSTPQKTQS